MVSYSIRLELVKLHAPFNIIVLLHPHNCYSLCGLRRGVRFKKFILCPLTMVTRNPPDFDWENSRDTVVYCTYLSGPSSVYCLCLTWWFYFPNFLIIKSHNKSTQQIFMMPTFTTDSEKGRYRGS